MTSNRSTRNEPWKKRTGKEENITKKKKKKRIGSEGLRKKGTKSTMQFAGVSIVLRG